MICASVIVRMYRY